MTPVERTQAPKGLPPVHTAACPPGCDGSAHAIVSALAAAVAPELEAAMAETRAVRDGYQQLCKEFAPGRQAGWSARIGFGRLNWHRGNAGLELFTRTESNDQEDLTLRYRRERDEARAQLADAAAIAARWPKCPDGCGCRLATDDADASECGCKGPCTMECLENGYPDAPSYRDAAVNAEREIAAAHRLRADHYEGLWRKEVGLPPEAGREAADVTYGQVAYEASLPAIRDSLDGEPWRWEQLPYQMQASWQAAGDAVASYIFRDALSKALAAAPGSSGQAGDDDPAQEPPPAVIVFDINEGIQGWFHELANEVYAMSGETVIISEIDAGMSDVMIAVATRPVSTEEAIAIWHGGAGQERGR